MGFGVSGKEIEVKTEDGWKHLCEWQGFIARGHSSRTVLGVDKKHFDHENDDWVVDEELESPVAGRGLPDDVDEENGLRLHDQYSWGETFVSSSDLEENPELKDLGEFEEVFDYLEEKSEEYGEARLLLWADS